MKVLITGNSGYIGSHLTKLLMSKGIEVHGLDNTKPKLRPDKFYYLDVRDSFVINDHYDAVIHLAALVKVNESVEVPTRYYYTNTLGTANICEMISTDNFIFASTGAAELADTPYGISKLAAEDIVREHHKDKSTIFRFYNVIGTDGFEPTNPDGLMYNLLKARETKKFTINGYNYHTKDGTCIRDYVHVMEICNAIESALYRKSNEIECLGHGFGRTVKEIAETFKTVNNIDFEIEYGERRKGDKETSVLLNPSSYMKSLYTFEELLRV